VFDNSAYAHDTRTQFMNAALTTHGAWDFPADARGYTWGAAVEYYRDDWVLRAGRFMQPAESNGLPLDKRIFRHYGDQVELEHVHSVGDQPGKLRVLAFRNRAVMGRFRDALDLAATDGTTPDVSRVRTGHVKYGFGLGGEQNLASDIAVFGRVAWNDGATETYAFTEIERSLSAGMAAKGSAWARAEDTFGMAIARNGLSNAHRDYLAAGGHGAFIGDGKLQYGAEQIVELYYSAKVAAHAWMSLDAQRIVNPAYNTDRGPVTVAGIRLHAAY
jgi:high affinity Mn2+ porin